MKIEMQSCKQALKSTLALKAFAEPSKLECVCVCVCVCICVCALCVYEIGRASCRERV